jgi:hypothetical protein
MSDLPEWYNKPPLPPTEQLKRYGLRGPGDPFETLGGPNYDVRAHYQHVKALYDAYPYRDQKSCDEFTDRALGVIPLKAERRPNSVTMAKLRHIIDGVLTIEGFYCPSFHHSIDNPPTPAWINLVVRPSLFREEHFFSHAKERMEEAAVSLVNFLLSFLDVAAPDGVFADTPQPATEIPLIQLVPSPAEMLDYLVENFHEEKVTGKDEKLFPELSRVLFSNIRSASGYTEEEFERAKNPRLVLPLESELPIAERCTSYLKDTPFLDLLLMPMPFTLPDKLRFSHMHIIAGAGHGKTQLIQKMLLDDLAKPVPPAIIIVEPKGTLIERVQRLSLFAPGQPLSDKLLIINPQDVAHPPALNLFDPAEKRFRMYSEEYRRLINNQTISLYHYIFGSIATALTQKQATAFGFIVRLMFEMATTANDGATIHTLLELVEERTDSIERSRFAPYIERLDYTARRFFAYHFFNRSEFGETKQQIAHRLYSLLQYREFDAMFSTRERKLDMFDAIQNGKIILVNTAKGMLGAEGSSLLGRFIIAQVLAAAFERVAHKEETWHPAFLFVDEAHEYFDDKTEEILDQAREFRVGITVAHQRIEGQVSDALASALATNTAIKYAAALSHRDASFMARNMQSEPEFIQGQRLTQSHTHFACYARGVTENAISVAVPLLALEKCPQMTEAERETLLEINRRRVSSPVQEAQPPRPQPSPIARRRDQSPPPIIVR